jgi:hypothetical protein
VIDVRAIKVFLCILDAKNFFREVERMKWKKEEERMSNLCKIS